MKMNKDDFWQLICEARTLCGQDMDAYAGWLREELMEAGPQQAQDFHDFVHAYQDLAYQYGLWSAASIICGGCTDDGFIDFRAWLIAQGWNVYWTALNDPDSLADVELCKGCQFEDLTYIGSAVLEELTGQDAYNRTDRAAYNALISELEQEIVYGEGLGYPYEPNEIAQRVPRLCARYLPPQDLSAMMERGSTWNPGIQEIQAARAAGPKNAVILRPWAEAAPQTAKIASTSDAERAIAAMKAETFRGIQNDQDLPEGQLAWYWSYIGSLDMAQELGLITEARRQALYREAWSYKPDCVVTSKYFEQQPTGQDVPEKGGVQFG